MNFTSPPEPHQLAQEIAPPAPPPARSAPPPRRAPRPRKTAEPRSFTAAEVGTLRQWRRLESAHGSFYIEYVPKLGPTGSWTWDIGEAVERLPKGVNPRTVRPMQMGEDDLLGRQITPQEIHDLLRKRPRRRLARVPGPVPPHPLDGSDPDLDFPARFTYPRDPRNAPRAAGPRGLASPLARQVLAAVQQTKEYKFLERMMMTGGMAG
jgi:hypothetical protein